MAVVFTGTTHARFADLPKNFKKYEHSEMGLGGYLNTLFYSDWALGEFMKMAEKTRWFERTIFIFMADHPAFTSGDFRERFHIPFVIFAPSVFLLKESKMSLGLNMILFRQLLIYSALMLNFPLSVNLFSKKQKMILFLFQMATLLELLQAMDLFLIPLLV